MHSTGTLIESQVDWLTASAHGRDRSVALEQLAAGLQKEEEARGNRLTRWRLQGYEGTHCGAVEWGRRDENACIIRLIGQRAEERMSEALSVADTITRLDIAATWRAEPPDPLIGVNAYSMAEVFHRSHPASALPWTVRDANGGATCYVGSPGSENLLRIYNKGAEALAKRDKEGIERYRACWRYELETKGGLAQNLAQLVDEQEDRARYVQNYVYTWVEQHGIEPAFPRLGKVQILPGFRRRSDADTRLLHLAKNVRPTVRWLRGVGREDDLREALELDRTAHLLRELQYLLESDPARIRRSAGEKADEEGETNHG